MKRILMGAMALACAAGFAQQAAAASNPAKDMGVIVSVPSISSGLDGYRTGIGLKLGGASSDLRLGADVFWSSASDTFSLDLNVFLENHFWRGSISPYWGGGLDLGFSSFGTSDANDPSAWTRQVDIPASLSAILGLEVFLLDNVSLFVEYELAADFSASFSTVSEAGTKTTTPSFQYGLDSRLGNKGCIGIVLYSTKRAARE